MAAMIPLGDGTFIDPITGRMVSQGGSMGLTPMPWMSAQGAPGDISGLGPATAMTGRDAVQSGVDQPPPGGRSMVPTNAPGWDRLARSMFPQDAGAPQFVATPMNTPGAFPSSAGPAQPPEQPQAPLPPPPAPPAPPPPQLPFSGLVQRPDEIMDVRDGIRPVGPQAPPAPAPAAPQEAPQASPVQPPPAPPQAAQATPQAVPQGAPVGPSTGVPSTMVAAAIYKQESGSGANPQTSVNGARGGMQIIPSTFARFAQPGENIDNPQDNLRVGQRMIDKFHKDYGGDAARVAVAYFSGEGNVAPPGSPTPWKEDRRDGNGKSVSGYVNDIMGRLGDPRFDGKFPETGQPQAPAPQAAPKQPPAQLPGMGMAAVDPSQFQSSFGEQMLALGSGMMGAKSFGEGASQGGQALQKLYASDREMTMKGMHLANDTARNNASALNASGRLADAERRTAIQGDRAGTYQQMAGTAQEKLALAERAAADRATADAARTKATQARYDAPLARVQHSASLKDERADIGPQVIAEGAAAMPNINAIIKSIDEGNWASSSWYDQSKKFIARATGMNILGMDPDQIDINDKQVSELANQLAVATGIRIMSGRELQMITKGFAQIGTNPAATRAMVMEKRDTLMARQERARAWTTMQREDPEGAERWMKTPGQGYSAWARSWMLEKGNLPHDSQTPITETGPDGKPRATPSPYTMQQRPDGTTIFQSHGAAPLTIRPVNR